MSNAPNSAPEKLGGLTREAISALVMPRNGASDNNGGTRPSESIPDWLKEALSVIRTGWPTTQEWTRHDTRDYGRQFAGLTPQQAKAVIIILRDESKFRPTVAEVREVVQQVTKKTGPVPAYAAQSYRVVRCPEPDLNQKLLTGETTQQVGARRASELRQMIRERLKETGAMPEPSPDTKRGPLTPTTTGQMRAQTVADLAAEREALAGLERIREKMQAAGFDIENDMETKNDPANRANRSDRAGQEREMVGA